MQAPRGQNHTIMLMACWIVPVIQHRPLSCSAIWAQGFSALTSPQYLVVQVLLHCVQQSRGTCAALQEVYSGVREAVGKAERALMYITGCKLEVALPYDAILELVQAAGLPALYKDLHVLAWNLCNDRCGPEPHSMATRQLAIVSTDRLRAEY